MKMNMNPALWVTSLAAALILCAAPSAQGQQNPRRIAVEGNATEMVEADVAAIHFTLSVSAPTLEECKRSYDAQFERLMSAIESSGVDVAALDVGHTDVDPQFNNNGIKQSLLLYKFTSAVTVYLRDVSMVTTFLGSSVSDGGAIVSFVEYSYSGEQTLRDSLRIEAVQEARERASALVEASGGTLRATNWIEARKNKGQPANNYSSSYGRKALPSSRMIWVTEQVEIFFEIE